jgi:hypothetical protein
MTKQRSGSQWTDCYFHIINQVSYLTIFLALVLLGIVIAAMLSGLGEVQRILQQSSNPSETRLVLAHITGTKWLVVINLLSFVRVIALLNERRLAYLLALLVLITITMMVWQMSVWSDQVLNGIITEHQQQGLMTGRPLAFMFGTSPGIVLAVSIVLSLNLAGELSIVLVSTYKHLFRATRTTG